jgi:hypothetical protein
MENDKQNKEKEISYLMSGKYIFLFFFFFFLVIDKDNFVKEKLLKIQTHLEFLLS